MHAWKHTCVGVQAHVHASLGRLLLSSCLRLNVYLCHSDMTCREKEKARGCEEEKAVERQENSHEAAERVGMIHSHWTGKKKQV